MPSIIAKIHDEKIMQYLQKTERSSNKILINSWIKVKKGYVIPVELKTIPYLDI